MPALPIPKAFELAAQHHQAGRLAEAEALCRGILAVQPQYAPALQLLGILAHQAGRPDLAAGFFSQVVALHPMDPAAYFHMARAHRALGRLDDAVTEFRQALRLSPGHAELHYHLGHTLLAQQRMEEATVAFRRALELNPEYAEAHDGLGSALSDQGHLDEAIRVYRRALALQPGQPAFQNNLGTALMAQGRMLEAVETFRAALSIRRDQAQVHNNLGIALGHLGQLDEAMAAYHQAIQLQPNYAEAHNNLGNVFLARGRLDEATAAYRRALQCQPAYPEAHNNLGNTLRELGQLEEAIAACGQALVLRPDYAEAQNNLGNALRDLGRLDEAITAYRKALHLQPGLPDIHVNLGNALKDQGQLDEAISSYRRALEIDPQRSAIHSNLVYTLEFLPGVDAKTIAEEQRLWNRRFSPPGEPASISHQRDRHPDRRLRIGYVSADFRDHVVGRNVAPLFRHHDHTHFEIVCYSGVLRPDALTEEIRRQADQWHGAVGVSDDALAEMIRQDEVDILVDLTQHLAGNRLPLFARRPAPVQVSFAGYPAGAGIPAIPYRISDRYLESEIEDGRSEIGEASSELRTPNSELRSPISDLRPAPRVSVDSFWCYDPCGLEMDVNALPAQTAGHVTFGSLNNFCKINDEVLELWARVLTQVPHSRLMLLSHSGSHRQRTRDFLARAGVEASQIEFVEPRPRQEYLELYHRLDVVLDPFPYGGHTTSLDALWMGVPVVSLVGERPVSRAGWSMLSHLGLPELAGHTTEDYVRIAVELGRDISRLTALRATLRARMQSSVLMDGPRFTHGIEAAYRTLWQQWCAAGAV